MISAIRGLVEAWSCVRAFVNVRAKREVGWDYALETCKNKICLWTKIIFKGEGGQRLYLYLNRFLLQMASMTFECDHTPGRQSRVTTHLEGNPVSPHTWKAILVGSTTLDALPTLLPRHTQPSAAGGIPKGALSLTFLNLAPCVDSINMIPPF